MFRNVIGEDNTIKKVEKAYMYYSTHFYKKIIVMNYFSILALNF